MATREGLSFAHGLHLVLIVLGVLILCGIVLPDFIKGRGACEAEAKANLHSIQLALEKYDVDHGGVYPAYLIGGASLDSDVLIAEGYLRIYARNPFVHDGRVILEMQELLDTAGMGSDPARPWGRIRSAKGAGYRFGEDGTLMGQVLCDPRYKYRQVTDTWERNSRECLTGAAVEYRFWDLASSLRRDDPYLRCAPGQFLYKSMGDIHPPEPFHDGSSVPLSPAVIDKFILGVYGGLRTKGRDILGEESIADWFFKNNSQHADIVPFWPWTRSCDSAERHQGSPFAFGLGDSDEQSSYGNANGIRDGVILVLTASEGL